MTKNAIVAFRTKFMLYLICMIVSGFSVSAQSITWTELGEGLPGANIVKMMSTSAHLIAISDFSVHTKTINGTRWSSKYLPIDLQLPLYGSICVTETNSQVVLWAVVYGQYSKLMKSTDLGATWTIVELEDAAFENAQYGLFASKDATLWLFVRYGPGSKTTLFKSTDLAASFEKVTTADVRASSSTMTELASGAIIGIEGSLVKHSLFSYSSGELREYKKMPKGNFRSITSYNNTIVIASDSAVYSLEYPEGEWREIDVPPGTKSIGSLSLLFLKSTQAGDLILARNYASDSTEIFVKKIVEEEFGGIKIMSHRYFSDALFVDNKWLFGDQAGVWRLDNKNVVWESEGMVENEIKRFDVLHNTSEIVAISGHSDVFNRSIVNKNLWKENSPTSGFKWSEPGNNVYLFPNGRGVMFVEGEVFYSTKTGAEWKTATLPMLDTRVDVIGVKVFNSAAYLISNKGVLISSDFGATYQWLRVADLNNAIDFAVLNDTSVVVALGNKLQFLSPNSGILPPKNFEGEIVKVLANSIKGIAIVRAFNSEKCIISRTDNYTVWTDSDTLGVNALSAVYFNAVAMPDNSILLTGYNGMYLLKEGSKQSELVEAFSESRNYGALKVVGNRVYRTKSPGKIEYADIPTSVIKENIEPQTQSIVVYPQPASAQVTIAGLTPGSELRVVDMQGCEVYSIKVDESTVAVNSSQFVPGVYTVITNGKSSLFMVHR